MDLYVLWGLFYRLPFGSFLYVYSSFDYEVHGNQELGMGQHDSGSCRNVDIVGDFHIHWAVDYSKVIGAPSNTICRF